MSAFAVDRPILDLARQIALAERRFSHALVQGCAREAARWLRIVDLLLDRREREAAPDGDPEPRPSPAADPGRDSWESKNSRHTRPPGPTACLRLPPAAEPAGQARAPP